MLSRIMVIATIMATSCSVGRDGPMLQSRIGDYLTAYSTGINGLDSQSNFFVKVHEDTNTLAVFQKDPFAFIHAYEFASEFAVKQVRTSPDAAYALVVGEKTYGIWQKSGKFTPEPVGIVGTVQSVAYAAQEHLMVLQGSMGSIVFLQFDAQGEILKSVAKGSLVHEDDRIVSGTLLADGQFIVGTESGRVLKVDLEQLFASSEWHYEELQRYEGPVKYLASGPSDAAYFWIFLDQKIVSYDWQEKVEKASFIVPESQKMIGFTGGQIPHAILSQPGAVTNSIIIVSADGAGLFRKTPLPLDSNQFASSLIDVQTDQILLTRNTDHISYDWVECGRSEWCYEEDDVYRQFSMIGYRLSDGLPISHIAIKDTFEIVLDRGYYYRIFDSDLGYAEKWRFQGRAAEAKLNMFYFEQRLTIKQ